MSQAVLISKFSFAGMGGTEYTHITIDDGFIVSPISRKKALALIEDLPLVHSNEYGKIYASPTFKEDAQKFKLSLYNILDN